MDHDSLLGIMNSVYEDEFSNRLTLVTTLKQAEPFLGKDKINYPRLESLVRLKSISDQPFFVIVLDQENEKSFMEAQRLGSKLIDDNAKEITQFYADLHDLAIDKDNKIIYYNNRSESYMEINISVENKLKPFIKKEYQDYKWIGRYA